MITTRRTRWKQAIRERIERRIADLETEAGACGDDPNKSHRRRVLNQEVIRLRQDLTIMFPEVPTTTKE